MTRLAFKPLHPSLGAEVSGLDLHQPVDTETKAELNAGLSEHLVLIVRDQRFTPEEYLAVADAFGPLMRQHYSQHNMPDHPDVGLIKHRDGQKPAAMWHTDHTNRERPPKATLLYGKEVATGGDTSVANMRAAFARLPEEEQRRLETLRTLNSIDGHRSDVLPEDREKYGAPVSHPMARTHPEHNSKAVYFHITKAFCIKGMTPEDSKAYMTGLLDRMIQPEIVYRHAWRKGDLFICDNRATMHHAHGDYDRSQDRVLWRLIIEGDQPR
jgi:alpha-ketoglutarate-dependent taurine dioxygenase